VGCEQGCTTPAISEVVQAGPGGDLVEPGHRRGLAPIGGSPGEGLSEGLLHELVGVILSHHPSDPPPHHAVMVPVEGLEIEGRGSLWHQ
jgi:hypothetical protein